ncbi:MAG: AtpZ/AtpI family protein [Turicibacter sp.]
MSNSRKVVQAMKSLSLLSQVGISMIANIFVGLFIGKFLDQWLGTSPLFLLIFIFVGVGSGLKSVYTLIIKMDKRDKDESTTKRSN